MWYNYYLHSYMRAILELILVLKQFQDTSLVSVIPQVIFCMKIQCINYYVCNCLPNFSQSCFTTSLLPIVATAWTSTSQVGSPQLLNHHSNTEVRHRCEWSGNWAWLLWMMSSWRWGTWSLVPKVFHSAASGSEHRKARLVDDPSRKEEQHE